MCSGFVSEEKMNKFRLQFDEIHKMSAFNLVIIYTHAHISTIVLQMCEMFMQTVGRSKIVTHCWSVVSVKVMRQTLAC